MLTTPELILMFCVFVALLALGAVITVSNERVRAATLQVRDVAREYALADLAMRRAQARQSIVFDNPADAMRALAQIAFDVTGERREFIASSADAGQMIALSAAIDGGGEAIFTPSARAFLNVNPHLRYRPKRIYPVNGMVSNPFVVEEIESVAQYLGARVLPRVEQWELVIFPPKDYTRLRLRGLAWLRQFR